MLALNLISTQIDMHTVDELWRDLVREERDRADRFRNSRDRARYVVTRRALRTLLGEHTERPADHVPITLTLGGKPVLAAPHDGVHFNVSHAGDWAMIAIANYPVGIDIEQRRPVDTKALAQSIFSTLECDVIHMAADPTAAFFDLWVAKEAWVKATGQGVSALGAAPDLSHLLEGQTPTDWMPVNGAANHATHYLSWLAVASGYHAAISVIAPNAPPPVTVVAGTHAERRRTIKNKD